MADPLDTVVKILALITGALTLAKTFYQGNAHKKGDLNPEPKGSIMSVTVDASLYVISFLVSAMASLSLAAALFSKSDLNSLTKTYLIAGAIAIAYGIACVRPIAIQKDLRHLVLVCVAGLLTVAILPILSVFRGKSDLVLIADSINVKFLLAVWVLLTTAFMTYALMMGDRLLSDRRRWLIANAALVCLSVLAFGISDSEAVRQDPRARRSLDREAGAVQRDIENLKRADILAFYQLASEATLSSYYAEIDERSPEDSKADNSNDELEKDSPDSRPQLLWKTLDLKDRAYLLRERLRFVHPVPRDDEQKVDEDIPGVSAIDRYRHFENEMIVSVLRNNPKVEQLYHSYQYPDDVNKKIPARQSKEQQESDDFDKILSIISNDKSRSITESYPETFAMVYGLPPERSARTIRSFYRDLAIEGYRVQNGYKRDVRSLITEFDNLKGEREAFLQFVIRNLPAKQLPVLAALYSKQENPAVKELVAGTRSPADFARLLGNEVPSDVGVSEADTQFISQIQSALNKDQIQDLRLLLSHVDTVLLSVGLLFRPDVLQFANKLVNDTQEEDRTSAIAIMDNPVAEGVRELERLNESTTASEQNPPILAAVDQFLNSKLRDDDREAILHNLSLTIYRQGGPFALGWTRQLVDDASRYSPAFAVVVSSLLWLPVVLVLGFLGRLFGKAIVSTLFAAERLSCERGNTLGSQGQPDSHWDLIGRESLLEKMRRLSLRASGTNGLVGRRGIGKTRLMRELFQRYSVDGSTTVWLDCPTVMSHEDFIQSISERLVDVVEARFAAYAEIPNYSSRRVDAQVIRGLSLCTGILGLCYVISFCALVEPAPEITLASAIVAAIAFALFFIRVSTAMTSTRSIRRSIGSERALFEWRSGYEAILRMTEYLKRRRMLLSGIAQRSHTSFAGIAIASVSPIIALAVITMIVVAILYPEAGLTALGASFIAVVVWVAYRRITSDSSAPGSNTSAASFTVFFRQFILELAGRIKAGALGPVPTENDIFVVFIDELDKIVDRDELRGFIRVIKSVLDIPGARFFLSISQDAYRDLILGSALGKNEFDSSFDHIELIGPMDYISARELAITYLKAVADANLDEEAIDIIALLGKGVARDILRRCDSALLLATNGSASLGTQLLRTERESLLAAVQYLAGIDDEIEKIFTEIEPNRLLVAETLQKPALGEKVVRVVCENLVYSQLLSTTDASSRRRLAEQYYEFLYELPILSMEVMRAGLSSINCRSTATETNRATSA